MYETNPTYVQYAVPDGGVAVDSKRKTANNSRTSKQKSIDSAGTTYIYCKR